jgi:hypothetical protein
MASKLIGTIRISTNPGDEATKPHYEITFVPFAGRLNTKAVRLTTHEELVEFLQEARISEDDANRWAGRARGEGVVIISGIERTESQLKDCGLLA